MKTREEKDPQAFSFTDQKEESLSLGELLQKEKKKDIIDSVGKSFYIYILGEMYEK